MTTRTPVPLPARPSLESLRKRAKRLAREIVAGDPAAVARVQAQLPRAALPLSLRDAQLVLAREHGFAGWEDLRREVLERIGHGLEWAALRAERAIRDDDVDELRRLVADHPSLLTWRDEAGNVLLQATTSYASDTGEPERERQYNRPMAAEFLLDAGAAIEPAVWERVLATGAAGMLALLERKGVLPRTLPILAATGELAAVAASLDNAPADIVNTAFMHACRFRRTDVARLLLGRFIVHDPALGRRVDGWEGREAFVADLCAHAGPHFVVRAPGEPPIAPWSAFVMSRLARAMDAGDFAAFRRWLGADPDLLGIAGLRFQTNLLEQAAYSKDRAAFAEALLAADPWALRSPVPPASPALRIAVEYGNAHLVPLLARIWPVPDDLPHAAGMGDLARVRRWFDADGRPALGDLTRHHPVAERAPHQRPEEWGGNDTQRILDTALAWACMNRELAVADFMLAHGADLNTRWATHEPASILHECALHANYETVRFLLDRGIDITITCRRYGATAEGWAYNAARDMKMTELLAAERERREIDNGPSCHHEPA